MTIRINSTGIKQIRQLLAENHRRGGRIPLEPIIAEICSNYTRGFAEFTIPETDSLCGIEVICRISEDGFDRPEIPRDGDAMPGGRNDNHG